MSHSEQHHVGARETELLSSLRTLVGTTAQAEDCYGGIRITVLDPARFPWQSVLESLTELRHEVWIRMRDTGLEIVSKPPGT
ncbi:MAG: hypothetical protein K6U02_04210 [Firmicutes bacterium]|nr:hypothetical protein [Bacillota bacterium]